MSSRTLARRHWIPQRDEALFRRANPQVVEKALMVRPPYARLALAAVGLHFGSGWG